MPNPFSRNADGQDLNYPLDLLYVVAAPKCITGYSKEKKKFQRPDGDLCRRIVFSSLPVYDTATTTTTFLLTTAHSSSTTIYCVSTLYLFRLAQCDMCLPQSMSLLFSLLLLYYSAATTLYIYICGYTNLLYTYIAPCLSLFLLYIKEDLI